MSQKEKHTLEEFKTSLDNVIESLNKIKEKVEIDVVKKEKLDDNIKLDTKKADGMKVKEIKTWLEKRHDGLEQRLHQLEADAKARSQFFDDVKSAMNRMQEILDKKDSIESSDNINMNNIKLLANQSNY